MLTDVAIQYLNFLIWDRKYFMKYNGYFIKKTFQEIIVDVYEGNIDDAMNKFFICEFNNSQYYFFEWVEKNYDLNTTQINISYLILKDIVINKTIDELKEYVSLYDICIK